MDVERKGRVRERYVVMGGKVKDGVGNEGYRRIDGFGGLVESGLVFLV